MAKPASALANVDRWTQGMMVDVLGITRRHINKAIQDYKIQPTGTEYGYPVYRPSEIVAALLDGKRENRSSAPDFSPDNLAPKERRDYFESEKFRLQVEEQKGNLVTLDAYRAELARIFKMLARVMDTMPDTLERQFNLSSDVVSTIDRAMDAVREQMFEAVTHVGGGESEPS